MAIDKDLVTVVVPTFNEEEAIGLVLDELFEAGYDNVLVVDGYSVDGTVKVAEGRRAQVVQQNGVGKTGALRNLYRADSLSLSWRTLWRRLGICSVRV